MERMADILARTTRATRGRLDGSRTASGVRRAAPRPAPAPMTRPLSPAAQAAQAAQAAPVTPDAMNGGEQELDSDRVLELPGRSPRRTDLAPSPSPTRRGEQEPATAGFVAGTPLGADSSAGPSHAGPFPAEPAATPRRRRRETHGMLALGEAAGEYASVLRSAFPEPARPRATDVVSHARGLAAEVCPVCHGAGFVRDDVPVGDPSFGQAVPCVCKERALEERRRADLRRMSSLDAFHEKTFATFDAGAPGLREAFEVARHYAEDPQGWLVLSGGYGAGKTHLAAAIASERLAAGQSVFFSITPDLLDHLRATFAPASETPYDELFDKVREAGLLALDDLGAENGTAWATEKLFQIINYRYNYRMPTVITTNHRLLSHMDERIRSRLSDISFVRHVTIEAPDYRERHTNVRRRPQGASGVQPTRTGAGGGRGGYTPR